jgi:hypothetical protein
VWIVYHSDYPKTEIKYFQLLNGRILKRAGKFYVELVVDEQMKHETAIVKGDAVSWTDNFYL